MPVQCPSCQTKYDLRPELLGKKLKCKCGASFLSSAPPDIAASPNSISPKPLEPTPKSTASFDGEFRVCSCGKKLKLKAELIGKKVKCPCGEIVPPSSIGVAPSNTTDKLSEPSPFGTSNDWLSDLPPIGTPYTQSFSEPAYIPPAYSAPVSSASSHPSKTYSAENEYLANARSELSGPPREKTTVGSFVAGRLFNASTIGGIGMMLGAAAWFVAGLYAGYIFFYPPVLFIFGIIGLARGLIDGDED